MKKKINPLLKVSKNPRKLWLYGGIALFTTTIVLTGGILWGIYHKDEPKFIPEETRKDVRGDLKENVAENIKKVWPSGGQALVDAAYGGSKSSKNDINSLDRLYQNEVFQFSMVLPFSLKTEEYSEKNDDYLGTITFIKDSKVIYDLDIFENKEQSVDDWLARQSQISAPISEITELNIGGRKFYRAIEAGDPDHLIFITSTKAYIYKFKALMDDEDVLKNTLESFNTN